MTEQKKSPAVAFAAVGAAAVLALAAPLISRWEGVKYRAYPDPATGGAPWTVCYGHTKTTNRNKTYTKAECDALLKVDMAEAQSYVRKCIPVPMLAHVEASLVDLVFNVGPKGVCGSTVQRHAMANNWPAACAGLDAWKFAGGRVYQGLVNRRADARYLCETGKYRWLE